MACISDVFGCLSDYFAVFGAITSIYIIIRLTFIKLKVIKNYILSKPIDFQKFGSWAVVTGATDGIGKAFSQELAKLHLNVVLISRSLDKLTDVAAEIESTYNVKTKVIVADFTAGPELYDKIRTELSDLDIGVLVNNVGVSYNFPKYFDELESDKNVIDIINVNCTALTMMTRIVLPTMCSKRKGVILNISSGSGIHPTPLLAAYSASKAYVDFFSRALQYEYKSKGLIIQSVIPFYVATKMSRIRKTSLLVPGAPTYARSALAAVGKSDRSYGWWTHAIFGSVVECVPDWLFALVSTREHLAIRTKALKRFNEKKKE